MGICLKPVKSSLPPARETAGTRLAAWSVMSALRSAALTLLSAFAVVSWAGSAARHAGTAIPRDYFDSFLPLPDRFDVAGYPATDARIALGRQLFFDRRLSRNRRLACAGCHDLQAFGADGRMVSLGHVGQRGRRNAPSVYNAAGFVAQFWDGRSPDVEDQSKHPVLNPVEMAMPEAAGVVAILSAIPGYVAAFEQAFPESRPAVTYDNMALAIGAFERGLVTPGPFDAFLHGSEALSREQEYGFRRFVELGCAGCHNGPALGGQTFEAIGHIRPYPDESDLGRFEITGAPADRMKFRVPGLRNVAQTAPYYHDGSIATLDEAVRSMATHQLGIEIARGDLDAILGFLDALTGVPPADYVARPELPPDGGTVPARPQAERE
jgi:cytochrome c peroxidase